MQKISKLLFIMAAVFIAVTTHAQSLIVEKAWAKPTFAMAKMGAAYGVIANHSDRNMIITGIQVGSEIAAKAELHETYMKGEMASMRQLAFPYEIASGEKLELAPRAKHIMLMGLQKPLEEGMVFDLIFATANGSELVMNVTVMSGDKHERQPVHKHHH